MVAYRNRRFEVDGRILQPIGRMILWSPKDIRPKRQANEFVIVRDRLDGNRRRLAV